MSASHLTAIAVFVKTPGLSPLKTRLAAGIGADKAMEFYRLSLSAVESVIGESDVRGFWAVGEKEGVADPLWQGMEKLYTGEGDLGDRQNNIYETIRNDFNNVILIGADAPQVSPQIIAQAISALERNDFVIGPAHDGGYYLFGGRVPLSRDVWANVKYSCDTTRIDLIERLPSAPAILPMLSDVDTQTNLADIVAQMPPYPNAAQRTLINWIETL